MRRCTLLLTLLCSVCLFCGCEAPEEYAEDISVETEDESAEAPGVEAEPRPLKRAAEATPAAEAEAVDTSDFAQIPFGPDAITVDGDPADWEKIPVMPLPFMEADTSSFKFCWREHGLYVLADVEDEEINPDPRNPWDGDSIEIFVEKDFAHAVYYSDNTAQYALSPDLANDGGRCHVKIIHGGVKDLPEKVICAWKKTEKGYVIECQIPAELMAPAKMQAGTTIAFNFALSDNGEPTEQFYCDKDEARQYCRPKTWAPTVLAK